jgi:hypothetical protein
MSAQLLALDCIAGDDDDSNPVTAKGDETGTCQVAVSELEAMKARESWRIEESTAKSDGFTCLCDAWK